MGEFEDKMHGHSLDEAESKLQWSKPGGFFGERLFKAVYEAAQHFRAEKGEAAILRSALHDLFERIDKVQGASEALEDIGNLSLDGEPAPWCVEVAELAHALEALNDTASEYATNLNLDNWQY